MASGTALRHFNSIVARRRRGILCACRGGCYSSRVVDVTFACSSGRGTVVVNLHIRVSWVYLYRSLSHPCLTGLLFHRYESFTSCLCVFGDLFPSIFARVLVGVPEAGSCPFIMLTVFPLSLSVSSSSVA